MKEGYCSNCINFVNINTKKNEFRNFKIEKKKEGEESRENKLLG